MDITATAFEIGKLEIRWYGIIIVLGMIVGIWWVERQFRRQKLNPDEFLTMCVIGLPLAIIGARLYYVFTHWNLFSHNPGKILAIWEGGLAIHGGLFVGLAFAIIYTKIKKLPFLAMTDAIVPGVAIAQAIGRWGNYVNQEAYGTPTTLPWAIKVNGQWVHPTFAYESLWNVAVFFALIWFLKRPHRHGQALAWYFILYSFGRFFIEFIREDAVPVDLGLFSIPASSLVSLACMAGGGLLLYFLRKNPLVNVYPSAAPAPTWRTKQKPKKKKKRK
ncbi:MAG: prolipoprotein diacylglyceryl transferase [Clostridiales bacterium]|nr:prolipoprotein diacylglyceryl transferase [Clostridiales bacterium]